MKRIRETITKMMLLSLVLLPFDTSFAADAAGSTTNQPSLVADAAVPFALTSSLQTDGTLSTSFQYTGTLAHQQKVELIVSKKGAKATVYQGKLGANDKDLQVKGLEAGQAYVFTVKVSDVKKDAHLSTDSYTGEFTIQAKQNGAMGKVSDVHLQLGEVSKNNAYGITEGEVNSFLSTNEIESNNTFAAANTYISGDDIYGKIASASDVDYYKVKFSTTGTANFWLGSVPSGCDYDLYVYDQNFNQVNVSMRAGNNDEMITGQQVTAGQTYYVKVVGYNSTFDANNYYAFHATNSAPPSGSDSYESNNTVDMATSVDKNNTIYGTLPQTTDVDYYRIYVPLRSTFNLSLTNIPTGTDYDVVLYDANQNWVDSSMYASNTSESISDTLNPGYYYVKVYSYSGSSTSSYSLSLGTKTIPVILLPGIGGTELNNNGSLTWFNLWDALLINAPLKHNLALTPACSGCSDVKQLNSDTSISPNNANYGLDGISYLSSVHLGVTSYYNDFVSDLKMAGYVPGVTLFGFPYDWRLDNHYHHQLLTNQINAALSASGASKVQVVAHSMGGLVIKDYMLSDTAMQGKIDQVITAGTPFLGAGMATKAIALGGYNFGIPILMDSTGATISANAPAVYQLAPSQEYENQVNAQLGRPVYQYIDIWGKKTNYTHAQLTAKYPNQAIVTQANQRHTSWDTSYPGVTQYHIIGDTQDTVTAFNYWEMKDILHWYYLEYVMTKGDGTVPLLSANHPGTSGVSFYYSNADHMGLVKDSASRAQILRLLKGDTSFASGIRSAQNTAAMTELTANSLTSSQVSFNGMAVNLKNRKTGVQEVVKFRDDGSLDYENSTAALMPHLAQLEDGTYNLQFFINKYDGYDITVNSADGTQFIVTKYDLNDAGPTNRATYGQLTNSANTPITITSSSGLTTVSQGGKTITGTTFAPAN